MATALLPLAEGFEEIEAITVIDVLRRGGVSVTTAALSQRLVQGAHGIVIEADTLLDTALQKGFDLIVLPGGLPGAHHLRDDARVQNLLQRAAQQGRYTAAICAAPLALASAGLLNGKRATGYPGSIDKLKVPGMTLQNDDVVQDGKVITSRGPATAMSFALYLLQVLKGEDVARQVGAGMLLPGEA